MELFPISAGLFHYFTNYLPWILNFYLSLSLAVNYLIIQLQIKLKKIL